MWKLLFNWAASPSPPACAEASDLELKPTIIAEDPPSGAAPTSDGFIQIGDKYYLASQHYIVSSSKPHLTGDLAYDE